MKSIDVIYKFGNLYDRQTLKRVLIEDGAELSIVLHPENIMDQDPNIPAKELLNASEKEEEIKAFSQKDGKAKYWKLFESGKLLYFEITAVIKGKTKESFYFKFEVQLLEDLYVYNKKTEVKFARFFECQCLVKRCLDNFEFFEPITAGSLNDAYTKTFELYFAMSGKSTCNAFDRFCENPNNMDLPIRLKAESIQD